MEYVIKTGDTRDTIKDIFDKVIKERDDDMDDYDKVKFFFLKYVASEFPTPSSHIHFNTKRLLNAMCNFGKDIFKTSERDIRYDIKYHKVKGTLKKDEVITFTGKLGNTTISMKITKMKTYLSEFEGIVCDELGERPLIMFQNNEEAGNYGLSVTDTRYYSVSEVRDALARKKGEMREYIQKNLDAFFNSSGMLGLTYSKANSLHEYYQEYIDTMTLTYNPTMKKVVVNIKWK
jgi:hypothetical protein